MITIIVAVAENGAIGHKNQLIYHISEDLKRFKSLTTGHTIIMGRKTFQSFPKGALPNRRNVVLTRNSSAAFPGAESYTSLREAIASCGTEDHIFVIGGAEIYSQAIDLADALELTLVHDTPQEADAFLHIDFSKWQETARTDMPGTELHPPYSFITYRRK